MKPTSVRLSETDKLAIRAAADAAGMRVSPFIRKTLIQRCNVSLMKVGKETDVAAVLTVSQEEVLKGLHNNVRALRSLLNQIARALNTMNKGFAVDVPPSGDDITATLQNLDMAMDQIAATLRDGGIK